MKSITLRTTYAICLLAGMTTHIWTIVTHGLMWDYGGAPLFSRLYWTSLTVLDPLAAALLFFKPRAGLTLTVAIIVSDVMHNTWIMARSAAPDWLNWMYVLQVLFLLFVLATARRAWRGAAAGERRGAIL